MRLIDADAFKEYICNALEQTRQCYPDGDRWAEAITEQFCLDIDEQPTIQPEPHWIPVTKQMPPINEDVLVSGDGYVWKDALLPRDESNVLEWYHDGTFRDDYAWQPLPEPYKKSEVAT